MKPAAYIAIVVTGYVVLHAAMEAAYLSLAGPGYARMLDALAKHKNPQKNYWIAALAYVAFFAATFYIVVFPAAILRRTRSILESTLTGFFFGLAVYGVYNLTNLFAFGAAQYDAWRCAVDVAYGVLSLALIGLLAHAVRRVGPVARSG